MQLTVDQIVRNSLVFELYAILNNLFLFPFHYTTKTKKIISRCLYSYLIDRFDFLRLTILEDTAHLSRETDCLETYIKKGIALGHFIYGRCIERGVIENTDKEEAKSWYAKVRADF